MKMYKVLGLSSKLLEEMDQKTKHGIDKSHLMIKLLLFLESEQNEMEMRLSQIKYWIAGILKRSMSVIEESAFMEGLHNYVTSEQNTEARGKALEYLLNADFLTD